MISPNYRLIQTSIGTDPAIVVVNTTASDWSLRKIYPWQLEICIDCNELANNGMPTRNEIRTLEELEDQIASCIEADEAAVFLARITCNGTRRLKFRVRDGTATYPFIKGLVERAEQPREWGFNMHLDPEWDAASNEFKLLESLRE